MVNPEAYYDVEPVAVYPTGGGAHNWAPMSFNPVTGLVYIPASYIVVHLPGGSTNTRKVATAMARGARWNRARSRRQWSIGPVGGRTVRGALQAWDPGEAYAGLARRWRRGHWRRHRDHWDRNLVFQTSNDGRFAAWSADKGGKLYELQTGKRGAAPPITYEVDGKQYVAFMAGAGRPAGTVGPNDAKVDNPPMLFVFALDGKAELPPSVPPPASAAPPAVR